jgi:transposase-like protein
VIKAVLRPASGRDQQSAARPSACSAVHAAAGRRSPCRHAVGDRWQADETYVKVAGRWRYVYRAIDQFGQVVDVFVSPRRDVKAAHRFFEQAIGATRRTPAEVVTDKAAAYPALLEELLPGAWHRTDRYANNHVECDHGRLKARLRPMRGFKLDRSAEVIIAGQAFVQNLRRGHYELTAEEPANRRVTVAFAELARGDLIQDRDRAFSLPGPHNATAPGPAAGCLREALNRAAAPGPSARLTWAAGQVAGG